MAFSYYEHHPCLMDFVYLPSTPTEIPLLPQQVGDSTSSSSCFLHCYSSEDSPQLPVADARAFDSSNSLDIACFKSSSALDQVGHTEGSGEKNRKINKDETSLITAQSKEGKISKQKRPNRGLRETYDKKLKADDMKTSKPCGEIPAGCIHVRARRGEATDSHSLAERVRREKISERMKVLQSLVPGCEKVTGKALMLDEIINYVQSLQNQVEFLSMRLASLNPMLYFGADCDDYVNQPECVMRSRPVAVSSIGQTSHLQPIAFEDGTTDYQMMGHPTHLFLQGQGTTSFPQDGSSYMMHVGALRQGLLIQTEDINTCSFQ